MTYISLHVVPQYRDRQVLLRAVQLHGAEQLLLHQRRSVVAQHVPADARRQLEYEHQQHGTHELKINNGKV